MTTTKYNEHIASQPDGSWKDGFDRGEDCPSLNADICIGRMTGKGGVRVEVFYHDDDYGSAYVVHAAGKFVDLFTEEDEAKAFARTLLAK